MIFQVYKPSPPLDSFIESFIYHEGYQPAHRIDRFLPDGNVELIIDLDDQPKFIYDNESLVEIQSCHNIWASGVRTEPISIHSGKDSTGMLIIAFKRGMAYPFFPFPMSEIANAVVDADLIWGMGFAFLRERILATRDVFRKFRIVEEFLLKNYRAKLFENPCVEFAVSELTRCPGALSLRALTGKIGYSQKHFISMFKRQVGVTPKSYQKIMRFQKTVRDIESLAEIDWAAVSLESGFYDQAHFIKDFKAFSGFTPEQYFRRRGDFLNYIPV